jgi:hypothetical protein
MDNPLDETKPNILDMSPVDKFNIINNLVYFMDKKFKLDLDPRFSRVNVYLGDRTSEKVYSRGARKLIVNPFVSTQELVIDIHTQIDINTIDFRLYLITDRINQLLFDKEVGQFTTLTFNRGYNIPKTPDGFVGYRLIYYAKSPQGVCR